LRRLGAAETVEPQSLVALANPPDDVVAACLSLWPKLPPERRRELLAALQQLSEEDATLDFHRIHLSALRDPDAATRILAVRGLWEQDHEDYMRLLVDQLRSDPEATVRAAIAETLANFVVGLEFGLLSEEAGEDLTAALRESIEDVNETEEVRATALTSLGASSEEWVAELIAEQYETGGTRMRMAAVLGMGRNGDDQWLPILLHSFDDEDGQVRAAAATAAGQMLMEDAVDPLLLLVEDDEEEVQVAAIHALGEIAGEGAERILADLMGRSEPHLRDAARDALVSAQLLGLDLAAEDEETATAPDDGTP
jgi:HEAT repeat protein